MVASAMFDDIRPYNDDEVRPTVDRLLADRALLPAVTHLRLPRAADPLRWSLRPLVGLCPRRQSAGVTAILDFQRKVIKDYLAGTLDNTTSRVTTSGLEQLDANGAYLFVSNHRDIAMDPTLIN